MHDLRRDYRFGELVRSQLPINPFELFHRWFAELQSLDLPEWYEVNAMTLSTRKADAGTSSRIVLLKEIEPDGFLFFTNYLSDKAKQIQGNPRVALNFHWPMMERQVRVEGSAEKTEPLISDRYFASRPRSSQLGAVVSPQSQRIDDESSLARDVEALDRELNGNPVTRPAFWGGYRVRPQSVEFWQGRPSRLHDRFRYHRQSDGTWNIDRLAP